MLTERAILDALARDRVLIGAKSVLHKYSSCSLAWSDLRNMTCFHHGSDPSKTEPRQKHLDGDSPKTCGHGFDLHCGHGGLCAVYHRHIDDGSNK